MSRWFLSATSTFLKSSAFAMIIIGCSLALQKTILAGTSPGSGDPKVACSGPDDLNRTCAGIQCNDPANPACVYALLVTTNPDGTQKSSSVCACAPARPKQQPPTGS